MDADFWHERWRTKQIAFHEGKANALMARHFKDLYGEPDSRVFLPLCGKTRDIGWLLSEGYRVAGAELSKTAVEELFDELDVTPERSEAGSLTRYSAPDLDIFAGDIFDLSASALGKVDVVYDRAALVALPEDMRPRYAAHLMQITARAPQFLITFDYDQSQMDGPPFSVPAAEIRRCYGDEVTLEPIVSVNVEGGLKGKCMATETLWTLRAAERDG
jgi:thiopurine S-methyltransferase